MSEMQPKKIFFTLQKGCPPLEGTQFAMGGELTEIGTDSWANAFVKYGDAETVHRARLSGIQIQSMVAATEKEAWAKAQIIPMNSFKPITQP